MATAPYPHPRTGSLRAALGRAVLRLLGWRLDVTLPDGPKGIIIVYPHTSNWDFPVGYLAKLAIALPLRWMGKDSLFLGPFGAMFRWMGGIPVNRRERTGFIAGLVREFEERDWLWLALAPEGTRKHTDHLKSGFWHLALAAKVPVGLAYIDWGEKVIGLHRYLPMTGDEAADLAAIRAEYHGKRGKRPGNESELRFLPR
ncbi:MAG: lysophospholipid acyltransferase family protein [Anaeromyxobacteraceae bacterium]